MKTGSRLLIDEHPLQVLPSLAVAVGLNEAIILQQIHYWLGTKSGEIKEDGRRWVFNSYAEWKCQFPFWSEDTIYRAVRSLERKKILLSRQEGNDRRKWYTIDYDALPSPHFAEFHLRKMRSSTPQDAEMLNR